MTVIAPATANTGGAVPDAIWRMLATIRSEVDQLDASGAPLLTLTGSLAAGSGDAVSDIDLDVLCTDALQSESVRVRIDRCLRDAGHVLAQFSATHIGLPDLVITFVDVGGVLVKVDVNYRHRSKGAVSTHREATETDLAGLHSRFTGWLWYTHSKIVRGELWEAGDSIAVMRAQALLPMLFFVRDLPREGYRRLESRLAPADLQRLDRTLPKAHHPDALRAALSGLCDLFETLTSAAVAKIGRDFRAADLSRMRELAGA